MDRPGNLIAIVKRRRAAQGEQQHRRQTRLRRTDPGCDARPVVVFENRSLAIHAPAVPLRIPR